MSRNEDFPTLGQLIEKFPHLLDCYTAVNKVDAKLILSNKARWLTLSNRNRPRKYNEGMMDLMLNALQKLHPIDSLGDVGFYFTRKFSASNPYVFTYSDVSRRLKNLCGIDSYGYTTELKTLLADVCRPVVERIYEWQPSVELMEVKPFMDIYKYNKACCNIDDGFIRVIFTGTMHTLYPLPLSVEQVQELAKFDGCLRTRGYLQLLSDYTGYQFGVEYHKLPRLQTS